MQGQIDVKTDNFDYSKCVADLYCPCGLNESVAADCWYEEYEKQEFKVPKWLKSYDIECPFERCNIYKGRHGIISFLYTGNVDDPLIVTFHGFNASLSTFKNLQYSLTNSKFSVLSFDLYGHGLSTSPKYNFLSKNYSLEFFSQQTRELIVFLKLDAKKATLIGVSMGCCIAAKYCQMYPAFVDKLIFLSPAGHITDIPYRIKMVKNCSCITPLVGCFIWPICFKRKRTKKNALWKRTMWMLFVKKRGPSGILACVNRIPLWNCLDLYQQIGKLGKPTLLLWGKCDNVIPIQMSLEFQKALSNSLLVTFENCGHLVLSDKPIETICTCIAFLNIKYEESSKINVDNFKNWLPFDQNGQYIPKSNRFIDGPGFDLDNLPGNQILVTVDEYERDAAP